MGLVNSRHQGYKTIFLLSLAETKIYPAHKLTAQLISAFVFATQIVQFLYFLNPKFAASNHLLCLCSWVCVRPGRKPKLLVFSCRVLNNIHVYPTPYIRLVKFQLVRQIPDVYVSACVLAGNYFCCFFLFYYTLANGFKRK